MGRRWLSALLWTCVWAGVYLLVGRWGMWWAFGAAGGLTVAFGLLVGRTGAALVLRPLPPPPPPRRSRCIRRIILEEEVDA